MKDGSLPNPNISEEMEGSQGPIEGGPATDQSKEIGHEIPRRPPDSDDVLPPPPPLPSGLISCSMSLSGAFMTEWYAHKRLGLPYSFEQFGLEQKAEELRRELDELLCKSSKSALAQFDVNAPTIQSSPNVKEIIKSGPRIEQINAAERAVQDQSDVTILHAAWYLCCSEAHIRRLGRQKKLTISNTRPRRVTSESLKNYKWRKREDGTEYN
jgi:hypothetical protein